MDAHANLGDSARSPWDGARDRRRERSSVAGHLESFLLRETPTSRAPPSSTAAGLERRRGPVASGFGRKRLGASFINICEGDMSPKKYKHVFTMRLPFVCDASVQSMSISASRKRHGSLSYPQLILLSCCKLHI